MKKYCSLMLLMLTLLILAGCQSLDYNNAVTLLENGDYEAALSEFVELGEYEDSKEKVKECKYKLGVAAQACEDWDLAVEYFCDLDYKDSDDLWAVCFREREMHAHADYAFLEDLASAVENRMKQSDNDNSSYREIASTELARLIKYEDADFYDFYLGTLARKYISGISMQVESFEYEYITAEIEWYNGMLKRFEALNSLYEDFAFLQDNDEFIDRYVYQLGYIQETKDALIRIDNSITNHFDKNDCDLIDHYTLRTTYTNDTPFDFDVTFVITYETEDGTRVDQISHTYNNIKSGSTNIIDFYLPYQKYEELGIYHYYYIINWNVDVY